MKKSHSQLRLADTEGWFDTFMLHFERMNNSLWNFKVANKIDENGNNRPDTENAFTTVTGKYEK